MRARTSWVQPQLVWLSLAAIGTVAVEGAAESGLHRRAILGAAGSLERWLPSFRAGTKQAR